MTYTPSGGPGNNSGYSVGSLQSDFGQRPRLVPGLVSAYYNWADSDLSKLLGRTALELASVMEQQDRLGLVPYANSANMSRRPLSSEEKAKFNAFLQTDSGEQLSGLWT